jgi:hypothetical protein
VSSNLAGDATRALRPGTIPDGETGCNLAALAEAAVGHAAGFPCPHHPLFNEAAQTSLGEGRTTVLQCLTTRVRQFGQRALLVLAVFALVPAALSERLRDVLRGCSDLRRIGAGAQDISHDGRVAGDPHLANLLHKVVRHHAAPCQELRR